jgi:hypothetical protein
MKVHSIFSKWRERLENPAMKTGTIAQQLLLALTASTPSTTITIGASVTDSSGPTYQVPITPSGFRRGLSYT